MSIINHQRVLITGVAGFIGSYLAKKIVSDGLQVTGIDNLVRGKMENIQNLLQCENFSFTKGDILDKCLIKQKTRDIDVIFHEAALIDVTESMQNPSLYEKNNVFGINNVLEAARINNVKRFVFASSCAVYGKQLILPIKEDASLMPLSPYAETKIQGEKLCKKYYEDYGIHSVILRYFNVYGSSQIPSPYCGVITKFIDNAVKDEPLSIYGNGHQTRDFIYVDDVCQANILAAKEKKAEDETFNIGSGNISTINDLASTILSLIDKNDLEIIHTPSRKGDITHSQATIEKAKFILGFKPRYDLNSGLKELLFNPQYLLS